VYVEASCETPLNSVREFIRNDIKKYIAPSSDGKYYISITSKEKWGTGSWSLLGPIEDYKSGLHKRLAAHFGESCFSYRRAHVDLQGDESLLKFIGDKIDIMDW